MERTRVIGSLAHGEQHKQVKPSDKIDDGEESGSNKVKAGNQPSSGNESEKSDNVAETTRESATATSSKQGRKKEGRGSNQQLQGDTDGNQKKRTKAGQIEAAKYKAMQDLGKGGRKP